MNEGITNNILEIAIAAQKSGNLDQASKHYVEILRSEPNNSSANHNLGIIKISQNDVAGALPYLEQAIRSKHLNSQFFVSLIGAHIKLGNTLRARSLLAYAQQKGFENNGFAVMVRELDALISHPSPKYKPKFSKVLLLYEQGLQNEALKKAIQLINEGITSADLYNFCGICFSEMNCLDKSIEYYSKALSLQPEMHDAYNNRGLIYKQQGLYGEAVSDFKKALSECPKYSTAHNNLGLVLFELEQIDGAISHYKSAILSDPYYTAAYNNLANCYKTNGNFKRAINLYSTAIKIDPLFTEAYVNLAMAHEASGQVETSIHILQHSIKLTPHIAIAHFNLGNIYRSIGKFDEAIKSYEDAIHLNNSDAKIHNNLGLVFKDKGKLTKAIESLHDAIRINPEYAEAYNNIAIIHKDLGDIELALENFNKASEFKPSFAEVYVNACEAAERYNKIDALDHWIKKAKTKLNTLSEDLLLYECLLHYRKKDFKKALIIGNYISFKNISPVKKPVFLNLMGKLSESSQNFDDAYEFFKNMNSLVRSSKEYDECNPDMFLKAQIKELQYLRGCERNLITNSYPRNRQSFTPVFMVGFPRSGTTLLDTVLRSHSQLKVVEEQRTLDEAIKVFACDQVNFINMVPSLSNWNKALDAYEAELGKHIKVDKRKDVIIDKLPLNMLNVPEIKFLFPEARFILVIRHPLDSIFSNWSQLYSLNPAMAIMTDLEKIIQFYCLAMEKFYISAKLSKIKFHVVRYEGLIDNLKGETSDLLEFLGLQWEDAMYQYDVSARNRNRINTPSYAQVIEPLYKSSIGRWKNYKDRLQSYVKQVKPWCDKFGYDI